MVQTAPNKTNPRLVSKAPSILKAPHSKCLKDNLYLFFAPTLLAIAPKVAIAQQAVDSVVDKVVESADSAAQIVQVSVANTVAPATDLLNDAVENITSLEPGEAMSDAVDSISNSVGAEVSDAVESATSSAASIYEKATSSGIDLTTASQSAGSDQGPPIALFAGIVAALAIAAGVGLQSKGQKSQYSALPASKACEILSEDESSILVDIRNKQQLKSGEPDLTSVGKKTVSAVFYKAQRDGTIVVQSNFTTRIQRAIGDSEGPIIIMDQDGTDAVAAAKELVAEGLQAQIYVMNGGATSWQEQGFPWKESLQLKLADLSAENISQTIGKIGDQLKEQDAVLTSAAALGTVVGAGALFAVEAESLIELFGVLAGVQFFSKRLLFADGRKVLMQDLRNALVKVIGEGNSVETQVDVSKSSTKPDVEVPAASASQSDVQVPEPEVQEVPQAVEAAPMQVAEAVKETPMPVAEAPEAKVPEPETKVPEAKAQVPEPETKVPEAKVAAPEAETKAPEAKATAPESEAKAPEADKKVPTPVVAESKESLDQFMKSTTTETKAVVDESSSSDSKDSGTQPSNDSEKPSSTVKL